MVEEGRKIDKDQYDRATQSALNEHANRLWHMQRRMHDATFTVSILYELDDCSTNTL